MHRLSIIIVNYRVPLLLGQCLESVSAAISDIDAEVWVVDNASGDNSMEYLRPRFPWVNFIENTENLGFSKANNIAIERSNSEYILLLNPDTIIAEDTLTRCLRHMQEHPTCGALGVKMHDIHGRFLRESKRGFPSLWRSLCKLSGLYKLSPRSRILAGYYLGHLSNDTLQKVEVLCCAYTMFRTSAIRQVGLLDERFFMYGEDIDLSYRIHTGGYECHYLPSTIIHYKGESAKRNPDQYYSAFYNAMLLFYQKYHPESNSLMLRSVRWATCIGMYAGRALNVISQYISSAATSPIKVASIECIVNGDFPKNSTLILDRTRYSWRALIDTIISCQHMHYSYCFINSEQEIISPHKI